MAGPAAGITPERNKHLSALGSQGFSLVGQSLIEAFTRGVPWTPRYYDGFLRARDSVLMRGRPMYLEGDASDTTAVPRLVEIDGEELYRILSRTIYEREGVEHWDNAEKYPHDFRKDVEDRIADVNKDGPERFRFDRRGIAASDLRITADFNARGLVQPIPIKLERCIFERSITLANARLGPLDLSDCVFPNLGGDSLRVDGDLLLPNVKVDYDIYLRAAHIAGLLQLGGATLNRKGAARTALDCNGATIGFGAFLRNNFSATGEVNFVRATIGGSLDCSAGTFSAVYKNTNGESVVIKDGSNNPVRALTCNGVSVGAGVFLRGRFSATGEVDLAGATIGGNLNCMHGNFSTVYKDKGGESVVIKGASDEPVVALDCSGVTIGAGAFLGDISVTGEVNFIRATINRTFVCSGGTFVNPNGRALICAAAIIGSDVFLRDGFSAIGEVNFRRATVAGNFEFWDASIDCGKGNVSLDLQGATIAGPLVMADVSESRGVIDLREAKAQSLAEDKDMSAWKGKPACLRLDGFVYERFTNLYNVSTPVDATARIAWLMGQHPDDLKADFRPQPWVHCARVLNAMGHDRAALLVGEAREWMRLWRWPGDWLRWPPFGFLVNLAYLFIGMLTGFGYAYLRATACAIATIAAGALIFQHAYDEHVLVHDPSMNLTRPTVAWGAPPSPAPPTPNERQSVYPAFNAVVYSFDTFLPVINLRQKEYWVPGDNVDRGADSKPAQSKRLVVAGEQVSRWLSPMLRAFGITEAPLHDLNLDVRFPDLSLNTQLVWCWVWFEIAMGWILSSALIARLSGLLDRDE